MNFGTRCITRYIAAIRWFIPLEVRENATTLTRAQNVINAVVMSALSGPLYAFTYHALGYTAAGRVILTCCVCMFIAPFLLRVTKSIVVAREVFLCAVFLNFSWLTYAMGGVSAPTAGWMVVPPMVAMFLGGFRTAMFWLGLTCATVVFIYCLPLLGILLPEHPIEEMRLLFLLCDFGLYIVIVFFVMLFELTKTEGFVKLQHALDFIHDYASYDGLTGGHKRSRIARLAEGERLDALRDGTPFSLCLLEIDGFKRINAEYGQAGADLVLREVATYVREQLGETGAFGRYGASQLLLLLPDTPQEAARQLAERLRAGVRQLRFGNLSPQPEVAVSTGVAQFLPGETIGQTIARADEALYQAAAGTQANAATVADSSVQLDTLTGLPGRRVLRDRLGHAMARALRNGRPVGLMLLHVNRLGEINAAFGVEDGDAVLAQAARQVRDCLHAADTVVRWSGDEFIVVLEDLAGAADTQLVADRILERFALPLLVGGRECAVTLAIGIALFPAPSCDLDALLARAERAMLHARNRGGNGVHLYGQDAAPAPNARMALKNDLRAALGAEQLLIQYQPQRELAGGRIAGVEALVGWAHPEHGLIEAARLMPLAEETGLDLPIGEWALRRACMQNAAWRAAGLAPVATSLRLSAGQLAHPGMAERILAIVKGSGIDPQCLALHVSEAALADDQPLQRAGLGRLRRAGIRICIDGFGASAGLGYLAELPADSLRLERAFVAPLGQPQRNECDERAWALAQSVVDLAHRLRMRVIADGVETEAQLADLQAMGCDAAQGAAVHEPVGAGKLAQLLAQTAVTDAVAAAE